MLITLNSSSLSDPKGLIGDIDEVAIFNKSLTEFEINHQYAVALHAPNEYVDLLKSQQAEGIYSFDNIGPVVSGLKRDNDDYIDIKLWMTAACEESPSFALTPANNKIQFVVMDSDSSPRDQTAVQNDPELQGDEQLVPTGVPYQGLLTLEWNNDAADIYFTSNGNTHSWENVDMAPNRRHVLKFVFNGEIARVELVQLPFAGPDGWSEEVKIFDSGQFPLEFRLRGGVGWKSQLVDHDADVRSVFVGDVEFGEYRSTPFRSRTPYQGVQIFQSGTQYENLVEQFAASDWGGSINADNTRTISDTAYRIDTTGAIRFEGIRTQRFWVQNPRDLIVSMSVISGVNLEIFFYDYENDAIIPVHSHKTLGNDWRGIEKVVSLPRAGYYAIYVTASSFGQWFVDEISVLSSSVEWFARQDGDALWSPLKNVVNSEYGGVVFDSPGKALQVRGVSKTTEAEIKDLQVQPQYAELGKITWRDES